MFVESNSSGYVNTNLIKNFEDVRKIGQYLAFKGWSTCLLNQREKNEISSSGFGYCYIDEPQQPLKAIKDKKSGESGEEGRVADFIATFDEIDNAIARGEQYRTKIAEESSFGLGMTPDEVDRVIRHVQRTATQPNAQSHQENVMNDEFITSTGPSTKTTPNLTQQTTTKDQTQHGEQ
nr:uncharacterized protein LOC109154771 [Ipomoea batatas]